MEDESNWRSIEPEEWRPVPPASHELKPLHRLLELEGEYQGYVLCGTLVTQPTTLGPDVMVMVRPEGGGSNFALTIKKACAWGISAEDLRLAFPLGLKVAVKEPFAPLPSCLVVACPAAVAFFGEYVDHLGPPRDAETLRLMGNSWFSRGNYVMACQTYSFSMVRAPRDTLQYMHAAANRAETFLKLKRYEDAIVDCNNVLDVEPRHAKCLYRKGMALMALHEHRQALQCLNSALESAPERFQVTIDEAIGRCSLLLNQRDSGQYDLTGYLLNNWNRDLAPECSDYIGPVEVRSHGRGKGVFLTKDVKVGELLMVSNPLAEVRNFNGRITNADRQYSDLIVETIRVCSVSSKAQKQLYSLETLLANEVPGLELGELKECQRPPQEALDVKKVLKMNELANVGYSSSYNYQHTQFSGVYPATACFNVSCTPNVSWEFIGTVQFFRASKDLRAGDELLHNKEACLVPVKLRGRAGCECARCRVEKKHEHALRDIPDVQSMLYHAGKASALTITMKLGKLYADVEKVVRELNPFEKDIIRAAYMEAYVNTAANEEIFGSNRPGVLEVLELMRKLGPGEPKARCAAARLHARCDDSEKERVWEYFEEFMTVAYGPLPRHVLEHVIYRLNDDEGVKEMLG